MCQGIVKYLSNFFFSDKKKLVAHVAQGKIELLSLVLLAKWCAKGVGTPWHSILLGVRDPFCFFENFFAQIFYYRVYN